MVFGTVAGSMADKYGRKLNCMVYGVTYMLSCMTKHSPDFNILLVGRLLGGVATSILFSSFEAWLVSEHLRHGYEQSWLSSTFSMQTVGNGIVAITAGLLAQGLVDVTQSPVAPFDLSLVFLIIGTIIVHFTWTENYGDTSGGFLHCSLHPSPGPNISPTLRTQTLSPPAPLARTTGTTTDSLKEAFRQIRVDRKVFLLGSLQSLFEGAMYTFVFMWTPTLEASGTLHHPTLSTCTASTPENQIYALTHDTLLLHGGSVSLL